MAFCVLAIACTDRAAEKQQQGLTFLTSWFTKAAAGQREDTLCHGLGQLKHPAISCAQMLSAAANIDPQTRNIVGVHPQDCFGGVCGDFLEIRIDSHDMAGNETQETALLKRDEGQFRLYWYRTNEILATLRAAQTDQEEENPKDPVHVAYDRLVAIYPSLYTYPPCYGVRVSSTNLAGELMRFDDIDVEFVETLAQQCPETFCFSLVGQKIAAICPQP